MAKGRKTGGRNILPGQVLNPIGGRAHNPIDKSLKRITQEIFREIVDLALRGDFDMLEEMANNKSLPAIKVGVARSIFNAAKKGDWSTMNSIVERLIGKVPDKVQVEQVEQKEIVIRLVKASARSD